MVKHKVFISFHHGDQIYKDYLVCVNKLCDLFIDLSVNTGDIDEKLKTKTIKNKIRDDYLRDSTVTIVLVGKKTAKRKHIDWEIYSSMFDGEKNKKSGLVVINLPTIKRNSTMIVASHHENQMIDPNNQLNWQPIRSKAQIKTANPYLPERIIDNLIKEDVKISVFSWKLVIENLSWFKTFIDLAHNDRKSCNYDLSTEMRGRNS